KKEYWKELPYSADYVIAFIPAESILSAALRYDPSLMHDALEMNVVLASPTSMWAILRTVSFTWRQENLSSQANEIIQLSQELYERLQTLGKHATKVSSALNNASQSWDSFLASFESRALVSARKLSGLSAETQPIDTVKVEARSLDDDLFERNQAGKSPEKPTGLDPTENLDTPTESIS
ncbi:MAG: DNA recombination protein RmuC, partial [Actinomyces sp. oral taxon 181]|uniref:DNA recombination protein RmuC n=1 Tax=Actinomyces sp. oral taxon 181 TaxID=712121 RepID=UPI0025BFD7E6